MKQFHAPLLLKILYTLYMVILIPYYWKIYSPQNFLWLSDIGLFLTWLLLFYESSLLVSIICLCVLPVEILWIIDFFVALVSGKFVLGLTHYMFDQNLQFCLRCFSLFHIFNPIIWLWYLQRLGYDRRALKYSCLLLFTILMMTRVLTDKEKNINWMFAPYVHHWQIPLYLWFIILFGIIALFGCATHIILKRFYKSAHRA